MQKSEQVSAGRGTASGVPGTASNSPGGSPEGAVAGSQAALRRDAAVAAEADAAGLSAAGRRARPESS